MLQERQQNLGWADNEKLFLNSVGRHRVDSNIIYGRDSGQAQGDLGKLGVTYIGRRGAT